MRGFFVTGTDTNVGKTFISALLVRELKAAYWKPIQSGLQEETDREWVKRVTGLPDEYYFPESYSLTQPLSPHLSARLDSVEIDLGQIQIPQQIPSDYLIVEGAGGVMVPLNEKEFILDLIVKTGFPVIVVARAELGTINHTLLTVEKLRMASVEVAGVVMNGESNPENRKAIEKFGEVKVIAEVPRKPFSEQSRNIFNNQI